MGKSSVFETDDTQCSYMVSAYQILSGYTIYESVATIYCYTIFSSALVLRDIPPMNGTVEITYGGETIIIEAPDTSGPGATADAVNAAVDEAMDAAVDPTSADGDLDAFFRLSALP